MPGIIPVRRALLRTPVAIVAPPAGFSLVASAASAGMLLGPVTTSAIDTTGANLLVVAVSQYNGATIGTLTDSKGNTWIGLTAVTGSAETYARLYYCPSPTVGSSHTFTFDNGGSLGGLYGVVAIQAWSGANASPFDTQNGATAGGGGLSAIQPGSVTPSQNNSLIVTSFSASHMTGYSIDGSCTITANVDYFSGVNEGLAMAYLVLGTAAATNPTWSAAVGGPNDMSAVIAVFKSA